MSLTTATCGLTVCLCVSVGRVCMLQCRSSYMAKHYAKCIESCSVGGMLSQWHCQHVCVSEYMARGDCLGSSVFVL